MSTPREASGAAGFVPLARPLSWAALALLLAGALDPMEGSVLIAAGAGLGAWVASGARSRQRSLLLWAAVLAAAGVAALFAMSAVGGIGGRTGRSLWWALLFVPYPVGWVMALVGTFKLVGELRSRR